MFGLSMGPKWILSHLLNSFKLHVLDLHLETWLWSQLICPEKALPGGVKKYMGLRENIHF